MKALSIRQPWAWLVCAGYKDVENRSWSAWLRGRVYVHAGLHEDSGAYGAGCELGPWILDRLTPEAKAAWWRPFYADQHYFPPGGAIIGEVDIVDCVTRSSSPWFEGPYGFVLRNPTLYEKPLPYKGRLGFFDVVLP